MRFNGVNIWSTYQPASKYSAGVNFSKHFQSCSCADGLTCWDAEGRRETSDFEGG